MFLLHELSFGHSDTTPIRVKPVHAAPRSRWRPSCSNRSDTGRAAASDTLRTSCFGRKKDTERRTKSFMRKGMLPVIAGNPPADAAQPSGMNGIMVTAATNEANKPRAQRMPSFLFQNPANNSAPNNHSETPKNQLAPRMPKTGYIQKISGPLLMYGINLCRLYSHIF